MRAVLVSLSLLLASGTAHAQELRTFIACPVYRDTDAGRKSGCWLADDPTRALDGNNLQWVLGDENSVMLEFIRANDPFQR